MIRASREESLLKKTVAKALHTLVLASVYLTKVGKLTYASVRILQASRSSPLSTMTAKMLFPAKIRTLKCVCGEGVPLAI